MEPGKKSWGLYGVTFEVHSEVMILLWFYQWYKELGVEMNLLNLYFKYIELNPNGSLKINENTIKIADNQGKLEM